MDSTIKKIAAYILVTLILVFTIIAVLGIWGFIDLSNIMGKMLSTLLIIFAASAIVLFIFTVILKNDNKP